MLSTRPEKSLAERKGKHSDAHGAQRGAGKMDLGATGRCQAPGTRALPIKMFWAVTSCPMPSMRVLRNAKTGSTLLFDRRQEHCRLSAAFHGFNMFLT